MNLVAIADREGALVLQRPIAGVDHAREAIKIADWLARHIHPLSCLDIIRALEEMPAVKAAMEEKEDRDDLRRCPLCCDGYSHDGKRVCQNCHGSNVVRA